MCQWPLFSLLAYECCVKIECVVEAASHGKDIVDGLNAVDKHYLKSIMRSKKSAQEDEWDIKIFIFIQLLKVRYDHCQ